MAFPYFFQIIPRGKFVRCAHFQRFAHEIKTPLENVADVVTAVGAIVKAALQAALPDFTYGAVAQVQPILLAAFAVYILGLYNCIELSAPASSGFSAQVMVVVTVGDIGRAFRAVHAAAGYTVLHEVLRVGHAPI